MTGSTQKSSESPQSATSSIDERLFSGESLAEIGGMQTEVIHAVYSLAYQQYSAGLYDKALKSFSCLCVYDSWNSRNFLGQAACLKMMKLYGDAIQAYLQAYLLDSSQPDPLVQAGDCAMSLNDLKGARDSYQAAIEVAQRNNTESQEVSRARRMLAEIDSEGDE